MNQEVLGALAGLATSVFWVFTSICFAEGGRRIGSTQVNSLRLLVALGLHAVTFRLTAGHWWPDVPQVQFMWLAISGVLGLAICDQALFTAFVDTGPRISLLAMTTSPAWAAFFGFVAVGERLGAIDIVAMAITVAGVAWVVLERRHTPEDDAPHPHYWRGVWLALFAAVLQAAGLMMSKKGMGLAGSEESVAIPAQGATYVRLVCAIPAMVPIVVFYAIRRKQAKAPARRIGRRSIGYTLTVMGAVVGPYLGVWLSLVSVGRIPVGVAQTLCSLSPVFILPIGFVIYRERPSLRSVLGALLAVIGSAMLVPSIREWAGSLIA